MQTAENTRFTAYVLRTTRPAAQAKRLAMLSHLDGQDTKSARDLAARVSGNSKDLAWISQAMRDGEILVEAGVLRLPSAQEVIIKHDWSRCLAAVDKAIDELEYCYTEDEAALKYVKLLVHAVTCLKEM